MILSRCSLLHSNKLHTLKYSCNVGISALSLAMIDGSLSKSSNDEEGFNVTVRYEGILAGCAAKVKLFIFDEQEGSKPQGLLALAAAESVKEVLMVIDDNLSIIDIYVKAALKGNEFYCLRNIE